MFIEYIFTIDGGNILNYHIEFDRRRAHQLDAQKYPKWTLLNFHQCPNCPLHEQQYSHCPVAVDSHEILLGFADIISCKDVDITVKTPEREYYKHTDAQTGLRAIIGFVMASSECPILSKMRGMAYFHLPFANMEETVFRVTSSYLLQEYFSHKATGEPIDVDFTKLKDYFQEIQKVNYHFLERIRAACEADSNLNVLATLFTISSMLSLSLERHLKELEPLFTAKVA